nr:hypothetical protein [Bosea sp. (in: a-proteobacteria)]
MADFATRSFVSETAAGKAGAEARWNAGDNLSFASATADAIGKTERTVQRDAEHLLALGSPHASQPSGVVGACSFCLSIFSIDGSRAALLVLFDSLYRNAKQLFANTKRFELAGPNQVADMPF